MCRLAHKTQQHFEDVAQGRKGLEYTASFFSPTLFLSHRRLRLQVQPTFPLNVELLLAAVRRPRRGTRVEGR